MSSSASTAVTWVLGTVAVAGGLYVAVQQMSPQEVPINVEVPSIETPEITIAKPPVAEVVRIDDGLATIAGEGNPGEQIVIVDKGVEIARAEISSDGTFAVVFEYDVPEDGTVLEITEENQSGEVLKAETPIAIVPKYGKTSVAKVEGNAITVEVDNREVLNFAGVVYGNSKDATISGSSTPGGVLKVFLNGNYLEDITVGDDGKWQLEIANLEIGEHQLKIQSDDEQLLETRIERAPIVQTTQIRRGDSLWRIAEQTYGDGSRYVDIYNLNAEQIENPDLIFPDQEFTVKVE